MYIKIRVQETYTKCSATVAYLSSGVVGRERMRTAFPHKKFIGNGVPAREILRDIFLLLLLNLLIAFN